MSKKNKELIPATEDFTDLLDAVAIYSEATNRLATIQAEIDQIVIDAIDARRKDFADFQAAQASAEQAVEILATRNRDAWFSQKKTLQTPYGSVSFRSAKSLEIGNEELTIALVERSPDSDLYLRRETSLNKEALDTLDDTSLESLRIRRVTRESCTIKPAKIDIGKAAKAAAESR